MGFPKISWDELRLLPSDCCHIFEPGRRSLCGRHHLFCPRRPPSSPRPSVLRASSARGTSLAPRLGGSGPAVTSSCRGPYAPELTWTGVQQAPAARPQGGPGQCWSLARAERGPALCPEEAERQASDTRAAPSKWNSPSKRTSAL